MSSNFKVLNVLGVQKIDITVKKLWKTSQRWSSSWNLEAIWDGISRRKEDRGTCHKWVGSKEYMSTGGGVTMPGS
jgi:hypothetical protein